MSVLLAHSWINWIFNRSQFLGLSFHINFNVLYSAGCFIIIAQNQSNAPPLTISLQIECKVHVVQGIAKMVLILEPRQFGRNK